MAITVNNIQTVGGSTTLSYTPTSGSNAVLVVCVIKEDLNQDGDITAISFGASGLTQALQANTSALEGTHQGISGIYYLTSPGTSTATITVTTSTDTDRLGIIAFTLLGVDQTTVLETDTDSAGFVLTGGFTPPTTSITTASANSLVLSCLMGGDNTQYSSAPSGTTSIANFQPNSCSLLAYYEIKATAGTVTHTAANNSNFRAAQVTVGFLEAAAGPADQNLTIPFLTNTGTTYSPSVVPGDVTLTSPVVNNTTTVYSPAVQSGDSTLEPSLVTNTSAVISPVVTVGDVSIDPPLIGNTSAVYNPVVSAGEILIQVANAIAANSAVNNPTIAVGSVDVDVPSIVNAYNIYQPTVITVLQVVSPTVVEVNSVVYRPRLEGAGLVSTDSFYEYFLLSTGLTDLNDAQKAFFADLGIDSALPDCYNEWLISEGYSGGVVDMLYLWKIDNNITRA